MRMQRPVRAGMRLALFRRLLLRARRLLSARRRRAGIARSLRRQTELGFQFLDPRRQKLHLSRQCADGFRLSQDQSDQAFLIERFKRFAIHPEFESGNRRLVKDRSPTRLRHHPQHQREQLLIEGETVTPLLLARRFTLNPVLVIISLLFWLWMWGIPGAILSMPMLAITKIICDRVRPLA